jgi:hypothetical protein
LRRALRPVPTYERAVREVSRMRGRRDPARSGWSARGECVRNRPRTTEDIHFLVGEEAFDASRPLERFAIGGRL